jgi:hypothetical protein
MKIRGQIVIDPEVRIQRLSLIDEQSGCWNWQSTTRNGYGRLIVGSRTDKTRKSVSAHRYSFEIFVGPIAEGLEVCHRCDNPSCVNPQHLFLGTRQDNIDDRESKGRNKIQRGENNGNAKLTDVDVVAAKRLRTKGMTYKCIAERFGVTKMTAMRAIKGQQWAHLTAAPTVPAIPGTKEATLSACLAS